MKRISAVEIQTLPVLVLDFTMYGHSFVEKCITITIL